MFCIADLMPSCQGGDTACKYLSATIFLTTLVWNNVGWNRSEEKKKKNDGEPKQKSERTQTNPQKESVEVSGK